MAHSAIAGTSADGTSGRRLTAGRVFAADARMTLALANEARYILLRRYFGVSREQANLVTAVLALAGADATYVAIRRGLRAPFALTREDVGMGGLTLREAVYGIAGPQARDIPFFAALVTAAVVGRRAVPTVRKAMHELRVTEHRIREQRLRVYNGARRVTR
jgi:hypothetical protein